MTISDIINYINTRVGSKAASGSLSPTDEQESYEVLANNIQTDWDENDPNEAGYLKNKPTGGILTRLDRVVYSTWNTDSDFIYNVPIGKTALFCIPYANPKVDITVLERVFTPDDFVQQANTHNIVNADAAGCSTTINGQTVKIQPKIACFYEKTGQGGSEFDNSSQINYVIDIYGI